MKTLQSKDILDRHTRQYIINQAWKDDVVDYLVETGIFTEENAAILVAERLLWHNKDEVGELIETDAIKFMKEFVKESLK